MKRISLFLFVFFIPILAVSSPGIDWIKYPRKIESKNVISIEYKKTFSGDGSQFFYIKCKNGRKESFLYEPRNSHGWFTVPPGDLIYSDLSPQMFALKICAESFKLDFRD